MSKKKAASPEVSFTLEEQDALKQMGISDPQNLSWAELLGFIPRLKGILTAVIGILDKFGPLLESQQAASEEG